MLCKNCGNILPEDSIFCECCGAKLEENVIAEVTTENTYQNSYYSESNTEPVSLIEKNSEITFSEEANTEKVSDYSLSNMELVSLIGTNADYYLNEFAKLNRGEASKFNWAVFLGGPIVPLYRKCFDFFAKRYLPFLIIDAIFIIMWAYLRTSTIQGINWDYMLIAQVCICLWGLIVYITSAFRFNRYYFNRFENTPLNADLTIQHTQISGTTPTYVILYLVWVLIYTVIRVSGNSYIIDHYNYIFYPKIVYEAQMPNEITDTEMNSVVQSIIAMLDDQMTDLGYDATIYSEKNRIIINLPEGTDPDDAIKNIQTTAVIEFKDADGNVVLTGCDIVSAKGMYGDVDETGINQDYLSIEFNEKGKQKFIIATKAAANNISLDKNWPRIYRNGN